MPKTSKQPQSISAGQGSTHPVCTLQHRCPTRILRRKGEMYTTLARSTMPREPSAAHAVRFRPHLHANSTSTSITTFNRCWHDTWSLFLVVKQHHTTTCALAGLAATGILNSMHTLDDELESPSDRPQTEPITPAYTLFGDPKWTELSWIQVSDTFSSPSVNHSALLRLHGYVD